MFDFAFSEMLLAALVALVVLGPERLPQAARAAGRMAGKLQRLAGSLKAELAQHADMADLRRMQETLADTANELRQEMQHLRSSAVPDVPAWERLPPQRTPADFGLEDSTAAYSAPAPALSSAITPSRSIGTAHTPTLRKRALSRKRDMRPRHRPTPKLRIRR